MAKFFTIPISVRFHKETLDWATYILERWPEKYTSLSHVVRAAVNRLGQEENELEEYEYKRRKGER